MTRLRIPLASFVLSAVVAAAGPSHAYEPQPGSGLPADHLPREFQNVGIDEKLGAQIPLDVRLRDEQGNPVKLRAFFAGDKPVVLQFVYHTCPTLCTFVQSGFSSSLNELGLSIGKDFRVLTVSIDPRDTPAIASEKKARWVGAYGRDRALTEANWRFLTGDATEISKLTNAVGFRYAFDAKDNQYAHSAALMVLTPTGQVARYLYGIEYPSKDLRFALAEATQGRLVPTLDHLMLYCYRYDPNSRSYVLVAWRLMRVCAAATVVLLGGFLALLWWRERKKRPSGSSKATSLPRIEGTLSP